MRFVKKINDLGKSDVYLDLGDLELPDLGFDIEPLLTFHIETYAVLKSSSDEFDWETVFGMSHKFLDQMSKEEQVKFAVLLIAMHYEIISKLSNEGEIEGNVLINLEQQLSKLLSDFDQEVNLMKRLIAFTEVTIPIQSFAGVGERAQDSAEMTFYRDDVIELTAIVLLCKLMTPIIGIFIEGCKKRMDNSYKEIHARAILRDILNNRCKRLIDKLAFFIGRIIQPMLNKLQLTHTYNGFTFNVILMQIDASMFTRRFITVDLWKPNGNLITYVTSCARAAAQTQFSSSSGFKQAVKEMFLRANDDSVSDEGNMSTLEEESRSSSKPADFPLLIKMAARQLCKRFTTEYDLNREALEAAEYYYSQSHLVVTPMNSFLMCMLFGKDLGGARGVEMLDMTSITKLIPVLQLFLLQQGYYDLIHMVSAIPTVQFKAMPTSSDVILASTWNNSHHYRNCEERFQYAINDIRWDNSLKNIVDALTTTVYTLNTAPVIWDMMSMESRNGDEYLAQETVPKSICGFILQCLGEV